MRGFLRFFGIHLPRIPKVLRSPGSVIIKSLTQKITTPYIARSGEKKVSNILRSFDPAIYKVLNNVTLINGDKSTQIDHVVVCPAGVIVIETKAYKGWIFGSEDGQNWTQTLYTEKNNFYNPILQNKSHINALKYHLKDYPQIEYYSIIVLAGDCEFKTPENVSTPVIYPEELKGILRSINGSSDLTPWEVERISNKISMLSRDDKEARIEHINNVKQKKQEAYRNTSLDMCPRCSGELVRRQGKYGAFMGCRNYPRCKFTQNM